MTQRGLTDLKREHKELEEALAKARQTLDSARDQRSVDQLIQRWRSRTFHLAVLGQFKRGKSTLINALMGRPVLPSAAVPLTAIPTFVRAGPPERLVVHFQDGRTDERPLNAIENFVTEAHNPENRLGVDRVDAYLASPFLLPGVCIIDTPGIGSVLRHNTAATMNTLAHCDAALFVLSPDPPLTETEETFLRAVVNVVPRIIPVLAKADILTRDELENVVAYNRALLAKILNLEDFHLYVVAASRLLRHGADATDDGYEFHHLRADLLTFFRNECEGLLRRSLAQRALTLVTQQYDLRQLRLRALRTGSETRRQKREQFRGEAARLRREQEMAVDVLNGDGARLIMTINRAAPEIAKRVANEVIPSVKKQVSEVRDLEEVRRGMSSVKRTISQMIDWAFTRERAALERTVRTRIEEIARDHISRSAAIVERLMQLAGEVFSVDLRITVVATDFDFHVQDYWPVLPPPVMLGTIPLGVLAPFLPLAWLRRWHARRIENAVEEAIRMNTERLRYGLADAVHSSLKAIRDELSRHYDELVQRVEEAVASATEVENENAQARQQIEASLSDSLQDLDQVMTLLRRLANSET